MVKAGEWFESVKTFVPFCGNTICPGDAIELVCETFPRMAVWAAWIYSQIQTGRHAVEISESHLAIYCYSRPIAPAWLPVGPPPTTSPRVYQCQAGHAPHMFCRHCRPRLFDPATKQEMPTVPIVHVLRCECGAHSCGSNCHSSGCPMNGNEDFNL
jgi:hypothetical protein